MTSPGAAVWEIRAALPASLRSLEELLVEFQVKSRMRDGGDGFAAELLVREAFTNAVVHGCGGDADKTVRCCLRLKGRRLLIAVADDGGGFDWRAASANLAAFDSCSGRGMEILRQYADHVRYNDRGNGVAMIKRLCRSGRHQ